MTPGVTGLRTFFSIIRIDAVQLRESNEMLG